MSSSRARTGAVLFSLFVATASFVGGIGAATAASDAQDVALEVSVVDRGGQGVGNAELHARWDGGSTNRSTAPNGKAFVSVPEGADVTIEVDHRNYIRNEPFVVENASERAVEIDVALRGQASVVVRNETGRVADASVRVYQGPDLIASARTDGNGEFNTEQIERGEYAVETVKAGYLRNRTTMQVTGQIRHEVAIRQESVLVTFDVSDDHFDPPRSVPNANVTIPNVIDVRTQGNGEVTVSIPVNDEYDVSVSKAGYESVTRTLDVAESRRTFNATVRRTPALNAETLNDQVVVDGRAQLEVTDEYGDPVANASVSRNGESVGETDANGVIRVPIAELGEHTLTAAKDGLETSTTIDGVRPADERTATATATPTPSPTPTETATDTVAPTTTGSSGSSGIGSGFGLVAALVALLALAAIAGRRG